MLAARRFLAACFILSFVSVFGHKPKGLLAWPADSIDTALAHPEQRLNLLDPNLAFEMSDVWYNHQTQMLWATAAGKSGKGAWAFQFHPETSTFSLAQFWKKPRDEGITQADLNPVSPSQHRVFIMAEGPPAQILQVLITFNTTSLVGETETERTWTIDEAAPFGKKGAEGITFVPDEWLDKGDFVDGSGTPYRQSVGGMNGLFFIAHQNGGQLYAVDVSSDGSAVFAGKDYRVVGVFATSALESSALYFDRSIGHLYISHGIDGNSLEIANLISSAYQSSDTPAASRKLTRLALYAYPLLSNPEGFATTPCKNAQGEFFNTSERWAFVANDCEVTETQECKDRSLLWYKNAAFLCKDFPASPAEDDGDDDWVWFLVGGVGLVAILSVVMIYSFWDKLPACCMRFCCCCKCCPKQKKQQKAASALLAGCGTTDSTPVSGSSNSNGALPAGFNGYSYSFAPNAASPAYAAPLLPSTTFVSP